MCINLDEILKFLSRIDEERLAILKKGKKEKLMLGQVSFNQLNQNQLKKGGGVFWIGVRDPQPQGEKNIELCKQLKRIKKHATPAENYRLLKALIAQYFTESLDAPTLDCLLKAVERVRDPYYRALSYLEIYLAMHEKNLSPEMQKRVLYEILKASEQILDPVLRAQFFVSAAAEVNRFNEKVAVKWLEKAVDTVNNISVESDKEKVIDAIIQVGWQIAIKSENNNAEVKKSLSVLWDKIYQQYTALIDQNFSMRFFDTWKMVDPYLHALRSAERQERQAAKARAQDTQRSVRQQQEIAGHLLIYQALRRENILPCVGSYHLQEAFRWAGTIEDSQIRAAAIDRIIKISGVYDFNVAWDTWIKTNVPTVPDSDWKAWQQP